MLCLALAPGCGKPKPAAVSQKTFATAEEAVQALVRAVEADDVNSLMLLFGKDAGDVIASGNEVQDRNQRAAFAARIREDIRLEKDTGNSNRAVILTGNDGDPFAVPLVRKANRWRFDTDAGSTEVLARRIGAVPRRPRYRQ